MEIGAPPLRGLLCSVLSDFAALTRKGLCRPTRPLKPPAWAGRTVQRPSSRSSMSAGLGQGAQCACWGALFTALRPHFLLVQSQGWASWEHWGPPRVLHVDARSPMRVCVCVSLRVPQGHWSFSRFPTLPWELSGYLLLSPAVPRCLREGWFWATARRKDCLHQGSSKLGEIKTVLVVGSPGALVDGPGCGVSQGMGLQGSSCGFSP